MTAGRILGAALVLMALTAACASPPRLTSAPASRQVAHSQGMNGVAAAPRGAEVGIASWYGPGFHGRRTASGQRYDMYAMTAAHKTLRFGTRVRVTNLRNRRSVVLTINDRGPFVKGRIIDVSKRAAQALGFERQGKTKVAVQVLAPAGG
jgi:rare lipoprotein A (peptidoglycan hydrolase)